MQIALIDLDTTRIIKVGKLTLIGSCKRCGECCKIVKCDKLQVDSGNPNRYTCTIYRERPIRCALWPQPNDLQPDGCGFLWIEMES